jgi:putative tryptophan/tyrosine transport system substrate-binding protein
MRRREFITLLGGAAASCASCCVSWPLTARAQPAEKMHRIGYLALVGGAAQASRTKALRDGLASLGYLEGKNLVIEERSPRAPSDRLAELASQLVNLRPDVIVTHGPGVIAAKNATSTIPIVMAQTGDAVANGLVASLARPGGNVTGMSYFGPELAAKRLELVKEVVPGLARAGTLINPDNPLRVPFLSAMKRTADTLKIEVAEFAVRAPADLEGAFAAMAGKPVDAFIMIEEPILIFNTETCANLAIKHRLPACGVVELAQAGGFMGYGIDVPDMWRRAATFVDKILKGAKPADLPVEQPTKFLTVVNLKTAKTIGIDIPTSLLVRADEVIE